MNRIQFYVVIGLSALLFLLVLTDILLAHKVSYQQAQLTQAQQIVTQGQGITQNLRALLNRLASDVQKTGDQGIKDLLARQQISIKPNDGANDANPQAAPSTNH